MQITNTSTTYTVKGVDKSKVNKPTAINPQQVERLGAAKNNLNEAKKVERFVVDEKALAEYEKANNALQSSQSQNSQGKAGFSRIEKQSHYQQQAIDTYQVVVNYQQRENVQQILGVDLYT